VKSGENSSSFIGSEIRQLDFPRNCLITTIRRDGGTIIPKGDTILMELDRLIIIGDSKGIKELRGKYSN
jgi:Trk K+ transport system NAD-binding subunit